MKPTPKQRIDWEQVRARLRASEDALEQSLLENPAHREAAFRRRAARLAINHDQPGKETSARAVLIFKLQEERYAIALDALAEVLPFRSCTRVPGSSAEFLGVINLHGDLRPVVDLGRLILHVENARDALGFVLVLRRPGREIGLRVDLVEGLQELRNQQEDPAWRGKFTKKMLGETLLLLDIEKVLTGIFPSQESLTA